VCLGTAKMLHHRRVAKQLLEQRQVTWTPRLDPQFHFLQGNVTVVGGKVMTMAEATRVSAPTARLWRWAPRSNHSSLAPYGFKLPPPLRSAERS
jgi:hypothetical protein